MSELVFTKRVAHSGQGYLVWIPKNIADFLSLTNESYLSVKVRKLQKKGQGVELPFVKRIARSGKALLIWIPKDVTDYLHIDEDSYCEFKIAVLGDTRG